MDLLLEPALTTVRVQVPVLVLVPVLPTVRIQDSVPVLMPVLATLRVLLLVPLLVILLLEPALATVCIQVPVLALAPALALVRVQDSVLHLMLVRATIKIQVLVMFLGILLLLVPILSIVRMRVPMRPCLLPLSTGVRGSGVLYLGHRGPPRPLRPPPIRDHLTGIPDAGILGRSIDGQTRHVRGQETRQWRLHGKMGSYHDRGRRLQRSGDQESSDLSGLPDHCRWPLHVWPTPEDCHLLSQLDQERHKAATTVEKEG